MVKANIIIQDDMNRVLNIVKVVKGFKFKNEALDYVIRMYAGELPEADSEHEALIQKLIKSK